MSEDEKIEMILNGEFYGMTEAPTEIVNKMLAKPEEFKITMHEDRGDQTYKATMTVEPRGFTLHLQRIH